MLRISPIDRPLFAAILLVALGLILNISMISFADGPQQSRTERAYAKPGTVAQPELPARITFLQRTVDDPIALYTLVLAIFTVVLAGASIWQGRFTQKSIKLANDDFIANHRP
jgi:hypothetical protein